jgi:transposase
MIFLTKFRRLLKMVKESKFNEKKLVEEVIKLYNSGKTCTDIGKLFSVSKSTIVNVLKRCGIERRSPKGKVSKYTNEVILEMYRSGDTLEEISSKVGLKEQAIMKRLKKMGVSFPRGGSRKHKVNEDFFSNWTNEMAYILGFIFADGCMSQSRHSITISQKESGILSQIANHLGMSQARVKFERGYYHLRVHSVTICKMLYWYGIKPNKSNTVAFPKIPRGYLGAFLRGVIDGDGWVDENGSRVVIYSGSQLFVEGLNEALVGLGLNSRIRRSKRGLYEVRISPKRDIRKLKEYIYANKRDLYLERKYLRFNNA